MSKEENIIYLDRKGYEEIKQNIERLRETLKENNMSRQSVFSAGAIDGWNSTEVAELKRKEDLIRGELQRECEKLSRAVIIEKQNDPEIIDIGDVVSADMFLPEGNSKKKIFMLVGTSGNLQAEIQEISINSPFGRAVYKKKVGDLCSYSVNGRDISVLIKEKLGFEKEVAPVKKLNS